MSDENKHIMQEPSMHVFDEELLLLRKALNKNKVKYIMVGGVATNFWAINVLLRKIFGKRHLRKTDRNQNSIQRM